MWPRRGRVGAIGAGRPGADVEQGVEGCIVGYLSPPFGSSNHGHGRAGAAHGRSLSRDYRVCAGHRGLITGTCWQESVCACACVWALDADHRAFVCLAEKIVGTANA